MRFSKTLYAIATILAAADAATLTEYFTAPTQTVWYTHTLQSVYTTRTQLATVYSAPPNYDQDTETFSSSVGPPQTSLYTSSEATDATSSAQSSSTSQSSSTTPESSSTTPVSSSTTPESSSTTPASSSESSSETPSSTVSEADQPTEDIQFANDILAAHNYYRELHHVGDLAWNNTLYEFAKEYVNTAFDCSNLELVHSNYPPYGENLAAGYVGGSSPVVDGWYGAEIDLVKTWDPISYSQSTGHLTQLLWRSSTQVGCARLNCTNPNDSPNWRQITLCNYYPRGNIIGTNSTSGNTYFVDNVFPI